MLSESFLRDFFGLSKDRPARKEQARCWNCRYWVGQDCRRHAPVLDPFSKISSRWPSQIDGTGWCGDHEPKPLPGGEKQ